MKTKKQLYTEFCKYKDKQHKNRIIKFETLNKLFNDTVRLQQEMLFWAYQKGLKDKTPPTKGQEIKK